MVSDPTWYIVRVLIFWGLLCVNKSLIIKIVVNCSGHQLRQQLMVYGVQSGLWGVGRLPGGMIGGLVGSPEVWPWQSWHFGAKLGILANLPPMVEYWAQYSTPICETPVPRGTWWGRCSLWFGNAYGPTHTVGICHVWKVIGVMGWKAACCGVFEALIVPSYSFRFRENPLA